MHTGPFDISRYIDQKWKTKLRFTQKYPETSRGCYYALQCTPKQVRPNWNTGIIQPIRLPKRLQKKALEKTSLIALPEISLSVEKSEYRARDCQLIETFETKFNLRGWAVSPTRQIMVPELILCEIVNIKPLIRVLKNFRFTKVYNWV